jgi:two-component system sensor histidine kinase/response regulator
LPVPNGLHGARNLAVAPDARLRSAALMVLVADLRGGNMLRDVVIRTRPARAAPDPPGEAMDSQTLHVLVVDDEPNMRHLMTRALSRLTIDVSDLDVHVDLKVDAVGTGEDGLAHLEANPVDILLLDQKLPGIQGMDVLQRVTDDGRDLVPIMVTAYASIQRAVSATKQGAFDFLAKPYTPGDLRSTVERAVSHLLVRRRARELERERHQVRFQFISVVAHELKSPLGAVETYLQLLRTSRDKMPPEKVDHTIDRCVTRMEGMRKLVLDLLDLTRIESGQRKREISDIDLRAVIDNAVESARVQAATRDITLELDVPESLPTRGDASEYEIILNNLLTNAVKYNKDGGRVDLSVRDDGDRVQIRVADTGIGMSAEDKAKLFREFVRIKNDKTRNVLGSGLGLSILKKLTALYDGEISVESEPDVGTTFTLSLTKTPRADAETDATPEVL